jgi:hypothetical protein
MLEIVIPRRRHAKSSLGSNSLAHARNYPTLGLNAFALTAPRANWRVMSQGWLGLAGCLRLHLRRLGNSC